ncbi:MAG: VWA domain-containing protein [Pirellulaceae bacterium]|nr:VWA domain-containing protein [Pirellulaceae bacterium]
MIIVLAAVLMIVMMAMLALSIDTGYMYTMQTQLDRSVDAAALAGAAVLIDGTEQAREESLEYLIRNPVGQQPTTVTDDQLVELTAQFLAEHANDYEILWGEWDPVQNRVNQTDQLPSAISVSMTYPNLPYFFGRVLGHDTFDLTSTAVAMYQPRDIVLVLDFSGSMSDDSQLTAIPKFGKTAIVNGLSQFYQELGSPVYGNIPGFEPQYITVNGVAPAGPTKPQISVEYRFKSVLVNSTLPLENVVLKFSNGAVQTFSGLSATSGTFAGTGVNAGKAIYRVWVKSGDNLSGEGTNYGEPFDFDASTIRATIKTALGLNAVAYPYPAGSWNEYIDFGRNNADNKSAGWEYKFGYANLVAYWLASRNGYSETPVLWKVSAQPVTALKDATDMFMDYILEVDTNDRVGLVIYNASNGNAKLETPLTTNLPLVPQIVRQRQAGHYHDYTNIGAGMQSAREHLIANGRTNAFKMIVLMTDGVANWNNGAYNITAAKNHVLSEAAASASLNYPIVTISLGAGADIALMEDVAEITESRHFNVPGGAAIGDYRAGLMQVFREIADARPLKLVQ